MDEGGRVKIRSRVHSRAWTSSLLPLALGLLLAGCVTPGAKQAGTSATNLITGLVPGAGAGSRKGLVVSSQPAEQPAAMRPLSAGTPPMATRTPQGLTALLAKRTANGDELIGELIAMRNAMQAERTSRVVLQFMGSVDNVNLARVNSRDVQGMLIEGAVNVALELARQAAMSIAFQSLEEHLTLITGEPGALAAETITLPSPAGMTRAQQQRAVTMAAMVIGARATNKVLQKAKRDFAGIETGYANLLDRREKAASVLFQVASRGTAARSELEKVLSPAEIEYLETTVSSMPLADFSRDLGAQNIALAYLEKTNPGAFSEYQAQSDRLMPAAEGYLRTVSGGVAFASMLTLFVQEVVSVARGKNAAEIVQLFPLALEFAKEMPALMPVAFSAVSEGVTLPFKPTKRFRVVDGTANAVELADAQEVFAELKRREAEPLLRDALFRSGGSSGLLHQLYMCSPSESGLLLDTAVPVAERERFAQTFLGSEQPRFSFVNAFDRPVDQLRARERDMGDNLLREDHRRRTDDRTLAFGNLQRKISDGGYQRWTDDQLMRLIYANREGMRARQATLQLGATMVRPVASAQSVFAYESLVNACRQALAKEGNPVVTPTAAPTPAARPPAARPAAPPAARPQRPRPANRPAPAPAAPR